MACRRQKNSTCHQMRAMLLGAMLLISCGATSCTGSSTKLPAAQCEAWIAFYNSTNGDKWSKSAAACTQTDPCSCNPLSDGGSYPVCDTTGTTVQFM
jgi:hypothetical protein